jgi:Spy/CpxP family protein refolding chaperone
MIAPIMMAQEKRTPPTPTEMAQHQVQHLTNALSLTATQQEQAQNIFTQSATAESTLRTNERAAHQALEAAIKANNTAVIQQQSAILGQLMGQSILSQATAHAALYQILTPEQQAKMLEMHKGMGMHGPGGPGMHGHDGPPPAPEQ